MDRDKECKLNNKGLSLVELIVAISIGVIVSGTIAALITFSIRMYTNESTNTAMQYELQSNINTMMDEIMGASVFVVEQNSGVSLTDPPDSAPGKPYTKYAMFGNIYTPAGATDRKFKGVIFVAPDPASGESKFSIYMNRIDEVYPGTYSDIRAFAEGHKGISGVQYLLGENATQFAVIPEAKCFDATKHEYTNPIEVRVKLQFEKTGWGTKNYSKHVDDVTYLRNKVQDTVYLGTTSFDLKTIED